ncbi:unnamed protein product [Protopolystoma xenopodis]|uniref:Uncharacterized protein n=1 Tax=Protopolystoma xenopodis TaxID=117903 RepID=A0A448WEX4_9PLAT|nr:unnamed protein product [Protopolystoma xenopodis]
MEGHHSASLDLPDSVAGGFDVGLNNEAGVEASRRQQTATSSLQTSCVFSPDYLPPHPAAQTFSGPLASDAQAGFSTSSSSTAAAAAAAAAVVTATSTSDSALHSRSPSRSRSPIVATSTTFTMMTTIPATTASATITTVSAPVPGCPLNTPTNLSVSSKDTAMGSGKSFVPPAGALIAASRDTVLVASRRLEAETSRRPGHVGFERFGHPGDRLAVIDTDPSRRSAVRRDWVYHIYLIQDELHIRHRLNLISTSNNPGSGGITSRLSLNLVSCSDEVRYMTDECSIRLHQGRGAARRGPNRTDL